MGEKILLGVIRIITVSEKQLEQMEQTQKIKLLIGALNRDERIQLNERVTHTVTSARAASQRTL